MGANSYMTRTNSSGGNRNTFTFSAWIKRSQISAGSKLFDAGTSTSTDTGRFFIGFFSSDKLVVVGGATTYRVTSRVFRDTASWYHIVVAVDTTQSTAADRIKVYVNGDLITTWDTNNAITENLNTPVNENAKAHVYGRNQASSSENFDGYFAHIHHIDGTQYAASDFGLTDSTTGIWKPKLAPSVTYGTNGVFLKFASSGSLGTDSSGNGNTFSVNGNLKQSQTTPSNVFCKPNQLDFAGTVAEMEKNGLRLNNAGGGSDVAARSTQAVKSGKWYYECKSTISAGHGNRKMVGFVDVESPVNNPRTLTSNDWKGIVMDLQTGYVYKNASTSGVTNVSAFSTADIVQVYFDADNGELRIGKNGTMENSGNAVATGLDMTYFYTPYNCQDGGGSNNGVMDYNFGEGTFGGIDVSSANSDANGYGLFEYDPTLSGTEYYALCTKNIKEFG